jgi:hypothetical protein
LFYGSHNAQSLSMMLFSHRRMPAMLAITIVNSTGSAGLARWNWKLAHGARGRSSSLAGAVSAIAGIDLDAVRRFKVTQSALRSVTVFRRHG